MNIHKIDSVDSLAAFLTTIGYKIRVEPLPETRQTQRSDTLDAIAFRDLFPESEKPESEKKDNDIYLLANYENRLQLFCGIVPDGIFYVGFLRHFYRTHPEVLGRNLLFFLTVDWQNITVLRATVSINDINIYDIEMKVAVSKFVADETNIRDMANLLYIKAFEQKAVLISEKLNNLFNYFFQKTDERTFAFRLRPSQIDMVNLSTLSFNEKLYEQIEMLENPSVKSFVSGLKSNNWKAKNFALIRLEGIGWRPQSNEEKAFYLIAKENLAAARELGHASIAPLISVLKCLNYRGKEKAIEMLADLAGEEAIEYIAQALKDEYREVRCTAAKALGRYRNSKALEALSHALKDPSSYVRKAAVAAIGNNGTEAAIDILTNLLKKANCNIWREIIEALEQCSWQPQSDLEKAQFFIVKGKWRDLVELGNNAMEPLGKYTKYSKKDVPEYWALKKIQEKSAGDDTGKHHENGK